MLLPGLFVRARIVEGVQTRGLLIPQVGISRNERGQAIALVLGADNVVQQRIVTTGQTVGNAWLVTSGLQPGDHVIVEGLVGVMPGMKVSSHPASAALQPDATPPPAPQPGGAHS
jgi:membrane fusion protein (multidrug efflux system)